MVMEIKFLANCSMGNILLYSDKQNLLSEMTPIVVPFLTNQEFMKLQISCVAWADDIEWYALPHRS